MRLRPILAGLFILANLTYWSTLPISTEWLAEWFIFMPVGVVGALFANATGAGGGVVFLPVFHTFGLANENIVASSFAIQCCGMLAGSLAWYQQYGKVASCPQSKQQKQHWDLILPTLKIITLPTFFGLWLVQYGIDSRQLMAQEHLLHWIFAVFSILLGVFMLFTTRRGERFDHLVWHHRDNVCLILIGFFGGMLTAVLSVGVGELVAIYCVLRGMTPRAAIALAVMLSAATVWAAIPYYLVIDQQIIWPVVSMAAIGAVIGGTYAKYIVLQLTPVKVKIFFACWVLISGVFTLL